MTINYNCTGADRKKLVASIAEITGADSKYLGAPTFAYQVDHFTIDRNGGVTFDDRADSEEIENLLEKLDAAGFHAEPVTDGGDAVAPAEKVTEVSTEETTDPHGYGLTITLPSDSLPSGALVNLTNLLTAKGQLIQKALGVEALPVEVSPDTVSFPWFEGRDLDADEVKTYTHFIAALCDMTRNQKRITAKEKDADNEKYAFRCFLLRLGFIGAEYKADRKILLRNLSGNSAFKSGQRNTETLQPEPPAAAVEVQGNQELTEAMADELLIQQVNASFGEEVATDAVSE
jgi:hypothetical protein